MAKNRNYSCKDVDMLMASKTIAESFNTNISDLATTRTDWTNQYATGLISRIEDAMHTHLGIDAKKDLRSATTALVSLQFPAKRDISYFKTQIDDDFKKDAPRRDEILKTLGFTKYLRGVQMGNQESLVQFLYTFKTNITQALRDEITAKGLNPTLITNITGYADTFAQANVAQESFKGSTKEISQEVADIFNGIYDEMIGICKKASKYYQYEPLKKEQFTFAKVLSNLGAPAKTPVKEVPKA
jgi:hypothetical protein